jgi:hypothetical protein
MVRDVGLKLQAEVHAQLAPVTTKTVFIGGVLGIGNLISAAGVAKMLATGNIGLYEHGVGMAQLSPSQVTALLTTWTPSGTLVEGGGHALAEATEAPLGTSKISPGYLTIFGTKAVYPDEVNMNTGTGSGGGTGKWTASIAGAAGHIYGGFYTPTDVALALSAFQEARNHGARTIAAFVSPNDPEQDLDDPFATGEYWAPVRELALAGGGLALDVPPNYAFQREPGYLAMIVQMIRYCNAAHLRSSLVVSPWALVPDAAGHTGSVGFDTALLSATRQLVAYLQAHDSMPTEWGVENYSAPSQNGSENTPGEDGAGTLNEVALFLSRITLTATHGKNGAFAH